MKRFHGLDRARGYGLKSVSTQAKLTAIVANLKRIAALLSSINDQICSPLKNLLKFLNFRPKAQII